MAERRCTFKCGDWHCGSYQFNLYKDDIDQGDLCDVHYWQGRAIRAESLAQPVQPAQEPVSFPCCGYTDAIKWNQCVVQCHMCGQVYTAPPAAQPAQEPVAVKHMLQWIERLKSLSNHGQYLNITGLGAGACWELANELEQFIKTAAIRARGNT